MTRQYSRGGVLCHCDAVFPSSPLVAVLTLICDEEEVERNTRLSPREFLRHSDVDPVLSEVEPRDKPICEGEGILSQCCVMIDLFDT